MERRRWTRRRDPRRAPGAACSPAATRRSHRGAGRAHPARPRRPDDRGDRERVPRHPRDDEAPAHAGEGQDQRRPGSRSRCRPTTRSRSAWNAVLAIVYLIFNEGYGGRGELADEAIARSGGVLAALMPDEPEVHGLLALMLITTPGARRASRGDELVLLADQDRSLWDAGQIERGPRALDRAMALRRPRALCAAGGDRLPPGRRPTSTGPRSRRSTASWAASPVRRSSSSTAPSPWRRPAPRGGAGDGRWPRRSTTTATCTRRGPSCCAGSAGPTTRAPPIGARSRSNPPDPERRFLERRLAEL